MELPDGVRTFNYLALRLFMALYESFPRQRSVEPWDLGLCEQPEDGAEPTPDQVQAFVLMNDACEWLRTEGFIRFMDKDLTTGGLVFAELTRQGFAALNAMPQSLAAPRKSNYERIKDAFSEKAPEALASKAFDIAAAILSGGGA